MTESERIRNVTALGYTEREARFMCRAALHGGYFVRRQYLTYSQCERGRTDNALTAKATAAHHVKELVFRQKRTVYSFCSKPFFEAIGNIDNRNRRTHEIPTIKSRLIGFDFVLSHPSIHYLPTEAEKVQFFGERLGIGNEHFPIKRYHSKKTGRFTERAFVDKFPVGIEADPNGEQRVVFTYVDDGDHSTSGFEAYIEQYSPLFTRLSRFRVVYVSVFREHFQAAERLFTTRIVGDRGRSSGASEVLRLIEHFRDRDAYERKDLSHFDQRKLIRFREDRRAFAGRANDALFERWRVSGDAALIKEMAPDGSAAAELRCEFSTWQSAFRYELFGTITTGNWRGE